MSRPVVRRRCAGGLPLPRGIAVDLLLPSRCRIAAGALDGLGAAVRDLEATRVLLVHGPNTERAGIIDRCRLQLDGRLVATFAESRSPTDQETAAAVSALARAHQVDAVVAVGGGSAIDAGKVAVDARGPRTPLVTLSTTLSGAELTPDCGVVDPVRKVKEVLRGPHLVATVALYDPPLLSSLHPQVLAGSAMNSLAHCVEALYTPTTNEFVQAVGLAGSRLLHRGLVLGFEKGDVDAALSDLVEGSFSAGVACGNAGIALHHTICHYVGPQLGLSHGEANAVMLPHVMRFNAAAADAQLRRLAVALEAGTTAEDAIDAIVAVRSHVGLATGLDEAGYTDLIGEEIAAHVLRNPRVHNNPRAVDRADVMGILEAAR